MKILGPDAPIDCETGNWGNWMADIQTLASHYYPGSSNETVFKTNNLTEYPDYQENEEYGNYTESDEEYDDDYGYQLDIFEAPPKVNCTCFRTDIEHEEQYRDKEVIKEGTIGGVPCGSIKETRRCKCLNYGMCLITYVG